VEVAPVEEAEEETAKAPDQEKAAQIQEEEEVQAEDVAAEAVPGVEESPEGDTAAGESAEAVERARQERAARREQRQQVRDEARRLRRGAENLREIAEKLEGEVEELEEKAEDLAERFDEADEDADEQSPPPEGGIEEDTVAVTSEEELEERHRELMVKLRGTSDSLLQKARDISLKVRQMQEEAGKRDARAERLEEKADSLDKRAFTERFPLSFGYQNHYCFVAPYDDGDAHAVSMSGLYISYSFKPYLTAGVGDIMVYLNESVKGKRIAISLAPFVSGTFFPFRKMEVEVAAGVTFQAQTGATGGNDAAVAPYVSVADEIWVARRFSLGPVLRVNYVAVGNVFVSALPTAKADVVPNGGAWLDLGLSFSFHF
jgi:hypothetical protein